MRAAWLKRAAGALRRGKCRSGAVSSTHQPSRHSPQRGLAAHGTAALRDPLPVDPRRPASAVRCWIGPAADDHEAALPRNHARASRKLDGHWTVSIRSGRSEATIKLDPRLPIGAYRLVALRDSRARIRSDPGGFNSKQEGRELLRKE